MIPNDRLSSVLVIEDWILNKDDTEFTLLSGYELGKSELRVTSQEDSNFIWYYWYENNMIKIRREDLLEVHDLFYVENVTELSVTFDQAMIPYFTYVINEITYLRWYDAVTQTYITTIPDITAKTPRIVLDYKEVNTDFSDVILFYTKNYIELCARYQRDRFTIEYKLADISKGRILRVGMNKAQRIQFKMEEEF